MDGSNASELVFRGAENTGSATIAPKWTTGLDVILRAQQVEQNAEIKKQLIAQKREQELEKNIGLLLDKKTDLSKYYQDESQQELNVIKENQRKWIQKNPHLSKNDFINEFGKDMDAFALNNAKRNEAGKVTNVFRKSAMDGIKSGLYDRENTEGLLRHIALGKDGKFLKGDQIDKDAVEELMLHPALINEEKAVKDYLNGIKQSIKISEDGKPFATELGIQINSKTGQYKFHKTNPDGSIMYKDGLPVEGFSDEIKEHIRNTLEKTILYNEAKEYLKISRSIKNPTHSQIDALATDEGFEKMVKNEDPASGSIFERHLDDLLSKHLSSTVINKTRLTKTPAKNEFGIEAQNLPNESEAESSDNFKQYENIADDGNAGYKGKKLEYTVKLDKPTTIPLNGKPFTISGVSQFYHDKDTGEKMVIVSDELDTPKSLKLTDDIIQQISNSFKQTKAGQQEKRDFISKLNGFIGDTPQQYTLTKEGRDKVTETTNGLVTDISNILKEKKDTTDKSTINNELTSILSKYKIIGPSNVKKGEKSIFLDFFNTDHTIKIGNDEIKFDIKTNKPTKEGMKILEKHIFNNNKERFVTKQEKTKPNFF